MYAIIKTGGKQYKVAEGDVIMVEKLSAAEGEAVVFDEVLTVVNDGDVKVGKPVVEGAKVTGKVESRTMRRRARSARFLSSSTRRSPTIAVVRAIVSRSRRLLSKRSKLNP